MLNVTIAERTAVEVATFDLTARRLQQCEQSMDAGTHSIALPQRGQCLFIQGEIGQ